MLNVFTRAFTTEEIQAAFESVTSPSLPGDFNANGQLDVDDINQLSAVVRAGTNDVGFDLNGDNIVNGADRVIWIDDLRNTWSGDSNLDGEFNSSDFVVVFTAGEFEDSVPLNSTWETGDWNGDGDFTTNDFVIAFQAAGYEQGQRVAGQAVPEPSGTVWAIILLCSTGLRSRYMRRVRRT
jgi:hypothetical protein